MSTSHVSITETKDPRQQQPANIVTQAQRLAQNPVEPERRDQPPYPAAQLPNLPAGFVTAEQPGQVQAQTATISMTTTTGVPQVQQKEKRPLEPSEREATIDLFNRFVAKDTHCLLGRSGIKISRVCLGTMNFGEINSDFGERPGQLSENDAHKILDRYVELGGNCIDTADFFPWFGPDAGKTEEIIGNWLSKNPEYRSRVFLITKIRMPIDTENMNSVGLSRRHLIAGVEKSLLRLQTDWIDMLVLNGWDNSVSYNETARNLDDLVRSDKIRYIGIADVRGWQLQKFIDAAKFSNLHRCVSYMGEYNLLTRGLEWEVLEVCKNERIGFIAYSPTKYGFLSNETQQSGLQAPLAGTRVGASNSKNLAAMAESFNSLRRNPVNMNTLQYCSLLSRKYNVSVSQIAIQWLLQSGVVTSVCVGVESVDELEQNMSCLLGEFLLSEEDMNELNFVSSVPMHYPYHTQLAEFTGFRTIRPIANKTEYEQLSVQLSSDAPELNTDEDISMHRLNLKETVHESLNQQLPERDFLRHVQMKTQPQSFSAQQQPRLVQFTTGYSTSGGQIGEQGRGI